MITAGEIMLSQFQAISIKDGIDQVLAKMINSPVDFLPVIDYRPGSVLAIRNLMAWRMATAVSNDIPVIDYLSTGKTVDKDQLIDQLVTAGDVFIVCHKGKPIGVFDRVVLLGAIVHNLNEELGAVVNCSYDGIYITDGDGVTLRINDAYKRITGLNIEGLIGRRMVDIVREGLISNSVSMEVIKHKKRVSMAQKILGKKVLLATGNPVFTEDGKLSRVITNVRDVSELVELKRKVQTFQDQDMLNSSIDIDKMTTLAKEVGLFFKSNAMLKTLAVAYRSAIVDCKGVLVSGESGVGKELVVKFIHHNSTRKNGPFVKINCAAIPDTLLESELFGYEDGAFTGARRGGKKGLFETADGGILFLDEIGDLPMILQAKLLRVLQENEVQRLGSTRTVHIDVRVITATNKDINHLISKEQFREDLFYRLNILQINIPPLRERRDDIAPLVEYFLSRVNQKYGISKSISKEAMETMEAYGWPGNVRQLANIVERVWITTDNELIQPEELPETIFSGDSYDLFNTKVVSSLKDAVEATEKEIITKALKNQGSVSKAATALGVDRTTILRKARKYGIC